MKNFCTLAPDVLFWITWDKEGIKKHLYDLSGCCAIHDEDYELQVISRLEADIKFQL